jgi:polyphosphate glucokinase
VQYEILLGVDVGGTGVKGSPVHLATGAIDTRERVLTPQPSTPENICGAVADVVGRFPTEGPIGCTLPAVVTRGVVETAANIDQAWIGTNARDLFSNKLGRSVTVINDADAAGVAEVKFGAARDVPGVIMMVTLGTGVGTALFSDGRLVPNTELGHLEVHGKVADRWASGSARDRHNLSWRDWAARVDDYLTLLHAVMQPELIVLGGGVVKHSDKFVDGLDPGCELRIAKLGNNAGIVGAALVAADPTLVAAEV